MREVESPYLVRALLLRESALIYENYVSSISTHEAWIIFVPISNRILKPWLFIFELSAVSLSNFAYFPRLYYFEKIYDLFILYPSDFAIKTSP
jgi:hypothetical protein